MADSEIVIIGAGVAGGAFATVMARAGCSVLMLEVTPQHRDVVRGEFMTSWGVVESQKLGLYESYIQAGAHHTHRLGLYDEDVDPAIAEAAAIDFGEVPLPPPLAIGHPKLCGLLNDAAVAAGARFLRGVRHTHVTPGSPPVVTFDRQGEAHEHRPRFVVAADGRHGPTRRQIGLMQEADPVHHWNIGLLVDGIDGWPEDLNAIGVEGWRSYFVFPQGKGRARVYLSVEGDQRGRMMGADGPLNMLAAFAGLSSNPVAEAIARGRPAGPAGGYPNNDTWMDEPYAEGVVLIGDAAGHNDPIIGQGLSIAHRDVRIVSKILKSSADWSPGSLRAYGAERAERMRRLRNFGRMTAIKDAEFTPEARERRTRVAQRIRQNPELLPIMQIPTIGPGALPADSYSWETMRALLA